MKKLFIILMFLLAYTVFGQQKFALVIGNGAYTNVSRLNNPVNDANDMEATLKRLGFSVVKVLNGNLGQMENAVMNFKSNLGKTKDSYGFFFYAGHGVQSNGENYLIPVDANIQSENLLRQKTVSVSFIMDEINEAGNVLNVIVLDACRDNPFSWSRSGSRGLTVVSRVPADSIIVYATSAGTVAADGTGRNGLFTTHLLDNLRKPNLEVQEMFRQTMGDVARASNNQQRPEYRSQFYSTAYLGTRPPDAIQRSVPIDLIASVDNIIFGQDIVEYNVGIDRDAQQINELILTSIVRKLNENPNLRVRIEAPASPYTIFFSEMDELNIIGTQRVDNIIVKLKQMGVKDEQMIIIISSSGRYVFFDSQRQQRNRTVELMLIGAFM